MTYPKSFEQPEQEQVEKLAHEFGHIFGLRHFFANLSETAWASEIFGEHKPFSIMNYGVRSVMTDQDRSDLKLLYKMVWNGGLTEINSTPVRLVCPLHVLSQTGAAYGTPHCLDQKSPKLRWIAGAPFGPKAD